MIEIKTSPPTDSCRSSAASPTISVVMSCYNSSRWLDKAIKSVLSQAFGDFEFIIIDDGSSDATWDIIQSSQQKDARIVPIRKENSGLAASLNLGIARAQGQWIARIDADDICEPTRLLEQLDFLRAHPEVVLLGSWSFEIDSEETAHRRHEFPTDHATQVHNLRHLMRFFPHSSALFSAAFARRVGCYNERYRKAQDRDLWLKLAEVGKIHCLPSYLVRIRKHGAQISAVTAGISQAEYAAFGATCHYLRVSGHADPSQDADSWTEFVAWARTRTAKDRLVRASCWRGIEMRNEHRLIETMRKAAHLVVSGDGSALLQLKLLGSFLPRRLAKEWIGREQRRSNSL